MLIKIGEAYQMLGIETAASCIPMINQEVIDSFYKTARELKKIAPKADDFLYFSAVIMHSAEAAALNDDGTPRLTARGEVVQVGWDKSENTWKWISNDPNCRPYKNSNGDIFPEEELIKAHKKWQHKPLCIDHKSSSVDHTRGFIVDTYYDRLFKRVIAMCALDKANYADLARKVSTGMQTAVSMGTAVGRAICYDCGRVARAEADFCSHMKNKSCYGEINIDLNPIELSIVVNGADPKANIKHIIASANTMNTYLENRAKELDKVATTYQATIIRQNGDIGAPVSNQDSIQVEGQDLESFRADVERGLQELEHLHSKMGEDNGNNEAFNQSSGSIAMDEGIPTDSGLALQTPQTARFASINNGETDSLAELHHITTAMAATLSQMKVSLDKLASSTKTHEENMSGSEKINKQGYFQGAGGVNEPTPGQVKYPKDPLNEQLREHEDKQMVGQPPFPEVGPVDGMHPSPASADPSDELARKKMLARAEVADRAMKRNAIVQLAKDALKDKQAYWLGGGGVNEPTPGKPKYPKDKLNEGLREYEDKQMVGQPPFPGVGPVYGLHPSPSSAEPKDELKRKEMLARASLKARFVKAANSDGSQNKNKSAWEVFQGDRLILTASVAEITNSHATETYESIATKDFGAKLIEKVKANGAEVVSKLIKKAQMPPAAPGAPADMGAPVDAPATPADAEPVVDEGKTGDPKQTALDLSEKAVAIQSDLNEAVRALTGEKAELGEEGGVGGPAGGPAMADDTSDSSKSASDNFSTSTLNTLRKELNGALTHAMKESIAELNDHHQELQMIVNMYDAGSINSGNQEFVNTVVEDALNEAKTAVADGFKLMTAFVKYARGTKAIVKRAEIEAELQALAAEGDSMSSSEEKDSQSAEGSDLMALINDTNADLDAVSEMMDDGLEGEDHDHEDGDLSLEGLDGLEGLDDLEGLPADDTNNVMMDVDPKKMGDLLKPASYDSREGRSYLRAKLAADALGKEDSGEVQDMSKQKWSDMLDQANRLTDGQTHLDVKPSESLGLVETLPEKNKRMMEVAKMPPKVRKEAEAIQRLVSEGKLDPKDVDALVAEGLDKDAVSYWKQFYGEVDGGSEFASELVKEHVKASITEDLNTFQVKMGRAYELAYDMVERGLCNSDRASVSDQVNQIMKFNDESFDSLKRVVAKYEPTLRKQAGRLPQVGLRGDDTSPEALVEEDAFAQLSRSFGTKRGAF